MRLNYAEMVPKPRAHPCAGMQAIWLNSGSKNGSRAFNLNEIQRDRVVFERMKLCRFGTLRDYLGHNAYIS